MSRISAFWASALGTALLLLSQSACSAPVLVPADGNSTVPLGRVSSVPVPVSVTPQTPAREDRKIQQALAIPSPVVSTGGIDESRPMDDAGSLGNLGPNDWMGRVHADIDLGVQDIENFYTTRNLGCMALGVGLAAPLANTSADTSIRHWYQRKVRGETTDEFANYANYGGELWVLLPIGLEAYVLLGNQPADYPFDGGLYEWSNRSLRSLAVGFPPVLAMYVALGASRPDTNNSHWHPFQDIHGVSGHTFVGAVPFLTAAAMTDNPYYKYPLLFGSFLTGWARINNDRHFFSQVMLGWWMAYLSVHTVDQTQAQRREMTIAPAIVGDGAGVAVQIQY